MKKAFKKHIFGSRLTKFSLYTYHLGDYMHRWCFKTPLGQIRLHRILRSDEDRALHDHPFGFYTLLLTGSYIEVLPALKKTDPLYEHSTETVEVKRKMLSFRWVDAEQPHRLILQKPVWTLVFAKNTYRGWGFYCGGFGQQYWIPEEKYFQEV